MIYRRPFPNILILTAAATIIFAAVGLFVVRWADSSREYVPVLWKLPKFEFTERSGRPFGLDDMTGKISVVDFIFTNCRGPCPVMAINMSELYETYAGSDKIQFVSISVDPERDSLEALRRYAADHGVTDNRWVFLRAPMDEIKRLSEEGFRLAADDLPDYHATKFVLVDADGYIRGFYDGLNRASLSIMKNHIRVLAEEMM